MKVLRRYLSIAYLVMVFTVLANLLKTDLHALDYQSDIEPILIDFCYDCHGDGMDKGKVALDGYSSHADRLNDKELGCA